VQSAPEQASQAQRLLVSSIMSVSSYVRVAGTRAQI
jgi:hypothetical protein